MYYVLHTREYISVMITQPVSFSADPSTSCHGDVFLLLCLLMGFWFSNRPILLCAVKVLLF